MNDAAQAVLDEWFGPLDSEGRSADDKSRRWYRGGPEFDAFLATRYGSLVEQALSGELAAWEGDPLETMALVLLLDQFTRNVFRDTPRMYAGDARAQAVSLRLLGDETKLDRLPYTYRSFLCMPLMHAEDLGLQERSVREFERLLETAPLALREGLAAALDYAKRHRDIVARFGHFPHRNRILGRPTSAEEAEFLKTPGSSF